MERAEFKGMSLDVCPECAGIWFDSGELGKLSKAGEHAMQQADHSHRPRELHAAPTLAQKLCPQCDRPMMEYRFQYTSEVLLDTCERCGGIWVEDGELEQMVRFRVRDQSADDPKVKVALCVAELDRLTRESKAKAETVATMAAMARSTSAGRWIFFPGWFV